MLRIQALTVALLVPVLVGRAQAQDRVIIDPNAKARRGLYPIAVAPAFDSDAALGKLAVDVQTFDLGVSSWFTVLDPRSFLADHKREGLGIEPQRWKDVGAFGVVKTRAIASGGSVILQFKLFELEKGAVPVLEREYKGAAGEARALVHRWCNDVVRYYTGEPGFFGSRIVFVANRSASKGVMVMDFDGHAVSGVTKNDSINILPAFSPSGGQIAFTSYMRRNPDLYVTSGGRPERISKHSGMNTGASYSPDGSRIAVTLSKDGNPEIYVINASSGAIVKRLTNNRYIDTSPAWSPDGREIAFVSNREGGPQIFVMNADGSSQRRVSTVGSFNQTPTWNPKKGTRQLAYTARDDVSGRSDIVTLDLATGKMVRITQNQGNNEEPTFAPNGRVLAFASTRGGGSGIYLANADGTGEQRLVYRGSATSPDWGPAR
jgi:TolB protein